jgi:predicted DNA-binding protein (UPF0251 family)
MFDSEAWSPAMKFSGAEVEVGIPTTIEARCYLLHRLEGATQTDVAARLNIKQGSVSRRVRRCEAKIEALIRTERFDREEINTVLRKLTGAAPAKVA